MITTTGQYSRIATGYVIALISQEGTCKKDDFSEQTINSFYLYHP